MEDSMKEVTDFSKYTDVELRKLLIDNAKPTATGMASVVREITKKYNACDREMMLWYINRPPYNGKLYAPDIRRTLTVEEDAREKKRIEAEIEQAQKERIKAVMTKVPKVHVVTPVYARPPQPSKPTIMVKEKSILTQFKQLGCKPVMIAEKTIGIINNGDTASINKVKAAYPDWKVVIV
jgi:hypothetical protein